MRLRLAAKILRDPDQFRRYSLSQVEAALRRCGHGRLLDSLTQAGRDVWARVQAESA